MRSMLRGLSRFCAAVMLICALFSAALAAGAGSALAKGEKTTLLVYMCGADIQDDACNDLIEMAEVEAGDAINIVVLAGGTKEWSLEGLKGYTRNLAVIRDGDFEKLEDWGYASMGDPDSLAQFLYYGLTEYPADRTIAILWNHGAGTEGGICFDEMADEDCLTVAEINRALKQVKQQAPDYHIDIFGCDACMMATYEMAAMLSQYPIDYYVASEELEPWLGWNYTPWLEMIRKDPSVSPEDICGEIIESFMDAGLAEDPDDYLTLSAVKLSAMAPLTESMERFAQVMSGQIEAGNLSALRRGRSRIHTFGSYDDASWDMVDLGAALDMYAQFDTQNATEVRKCLSEAVIASSQTDNLDTCCGMAILIPQDTTDDFAEYRAGIELSDIIPNWVNFVNGYVAGLQGGSYQFTASAAEPLTEGEDIRDTLVTVSSMPSGTCPWNEEGACYGEETAAEEITVSAGAQGFTARLSQEDLANLDYVEGVLLMNVSDEEMEAYVDFGLMRNNLIDWNTGLVCSLYDGSWNMLAGQPVVMYDQSSNEHSRRSLIPVKVNGEYTYLVVVFPAGGTEGRIIGTNAGYDANGLPIRSTTALKPGDEIIPVYTMYYRTDGMEELDETEFDGDPIRWEEGMTVSCQKAEEGELEMDMAFCFIFNDIFGGETVSEFCSFTL